MHPGEQLVAVRTFENGTFDGEYDSSKSRVRQPGVEPGSTAWKATMLTVTPPTLHTCTSACI